MTSRILGTLREWDRQRSFGFLTPDDDAMVRANSIFVHRRAFTQSGLRAPSVGQRYSFGLQLGPTGKPEAFDLTIILNSAAPDRNGAPLAGGGSSQSLRRRQSIVVM
jgi:cold shock CspA family protein